MKILELNVFAGVYLNEIPGNTVIPIQQNDISLIKEVVKVEDDIVNALFTFKNTSEKEVNVQMGFPFIKTADLPKNFIVKIDGKESLIEKEKITESIKDKIGLEYDFMYIWSITFKPKEKKTIECIYNIQWTTDITYPSGSSFTFITKTGALWKNNIEQTEFYIKLEDHVSKLLRQKKIELEIKPKGYKIINYQTIKWHFINWKPKEDISITVWEK